MDDPDDKTTFYKSKKGVVARFDAVLKVQCLRAARATRLTTVYELT
jgi:hypothetical protein